MGDDKDSIQTGGGAYIQGDVSAGGDFVGRDKINTLIHNMEQTNVERQEITNVFLIAGPQGIESLATYLADQYGLRRGSFQDVGLSPPPDSQRRQIEEIQAAQREVATQGVSLTSEAAFTMGMLAAYRRDYRSAKDYFHQAIEVQSRAMQDLTHGDFTGAMQQLETAQSLVRHTDPLDANALALRGYIEKTIAQLCHIQGDQVGEQMHHAESARMFEGAVQRDPENASAYNGLGNLRHASGEIDAAIEAYEKAISLEPDYPAAWHDLAIAFEEKMMSDPEHSGEWVQKSLNAWRQVYRLAPDDPGFSAEYTLQIGQRIRYYEKQLGE